MLRRCLWINIYTDIWPRTRSHRFSLENIFFLTIIIYIQSSTFSEFTSSRIQIWQNCAVISLKRKKIVNGSKNFQTVKLKQKVWFLNIRAFYLFAFNFMEMNPADSHFSVTAPSDHVLSIFFDNSSCPARNSRSSLSVSKIKSHLESDTIFKQY